MRVLGVDHGERRVGLALSSEDGSIALPHKTLTRTDPDLLLSEIHEVVRKNDVIEIVVGLPITLEGKEGASARRARRFAERLEEMIGIPVTMWDERMTSAAAARSMRQAGTKKKRKREVVDQVAAALLLSSYLDQRERDETWRAAVPEQDELPRDVGPAGRRRKGRSRGR